MKGRKLLSFILALALCIGSAVPSLAASSALAPDATAVEAANRLYELGLFSGVGNNADGTPNFDLTRTLNRQEAVTMLVRLLGKENEAMAGDYTIPFTDVADWAIPFVDYAYENGLTSGTSTTTFDGTENVSATQYLTFVLRALGYSSDSDFAWDAAWILTDELGITNGEYGEGAVLVRGEAAVISANALDVTMKDGSKTLLEVVNEARNVQWPRNEYTAQIPHLTDTVKIKYAWLAEDRNCFSVWFEEGAFTPAIAENYVNEMKNAGFEVTAMILPVGDERFDALPDEVKRGMFGYVCTNDTGYTVEITEKILSIYPPEEVSPAETAQTITYTYKDYFTVELPASWENKYTVEENDFGGLSFISTANRNAGEGGILFEISIYNMADWEEQKTGILDMFGGFLTELGEANGKMFVLITPGDVEYSINDEALKKEYEDMTNGIESIVASFTAL